MLRVSLRQVLAITIILGAVWEHDASAQQAARGEEPSRL
jgi:hypothetical protein